MALRHIKTMVFTGILAVSSMVFATSSTFDGYTFVFSGSTATLYDMDKQIVHQWTNLASNAACCADLLRDSSILWQSSAKNTGWQNGGALQGGRFQIIKWDNTVAWDYTYASVDYMPHHDMEPVYYTNDPREKPNILVISYTVWGDKITELKPTGLNTAEVVWEWCGSDHTCDSGKGTDKPEVLDKAKGGAGMGGGFGKSATGGIFPGNRTFDRMHTNNVSFNRTLNQLVLSVKGYNEIMVIDHSTTTAQAKGTTGGRWGKGGNILYRWGMPSNYGMSDAQQLRGQHCGSWIPDTMLGSGLPIPGAFNMVCVDNMNKRVVEIIPAGTSNGVYPRTAGTAYAPGSTLWTYAVSDMQGNEGTVQRLPNGNTLICTGGTGMGGIGGKGCRVFEITSGSSPQIVWELKDIPQSSEGVRYPYGYLGGKVGSAVDARPDYSTRRLSKIALNPLTGRISLSSNSDYSNARLSLFSMNGRELIHLGIPGAQGWDLGHQPNGQYLVQINSGNKIIRGHIVIR
jgi:hypothetical protein